MFDQLKVAIKKAKKTVAVSEVVQQPVIEVKPEQTATRDLIAELGLSKPGAAFRPTPAAATVPATPQVEEICGTSQLWAAQEAERITDSKVAAFLRLSPSCTRLEIAGATELSKQVVQESLDRLLAAGTVLPDSGEFENTRMYRLAVAQPVKPAAPLPLTSAEQHWSDSQRKAGLERYRREHPEETYIPPARYEPTDEEIAAEQAKNVVTPLSESERADLEQRMRNRRPVNQQQFIK
jgi:hypothetical protein